MDVDFGAEILKNSVRFLLQASEIIPLQIPCLKSFYASKSRILGLQGDVSLPAAVTKSTVRCPRCCLPFTDYPPSVVLTPSERTNRFLKRIQRKSENEETHTLYQIKRSAEAKNVNCNTITKICQNCKYQSKTFIQKPTKEKIMNNAAIRLAKRKKRKKDKFCGLVKEAVISCNKKEQKPEETEKSKNKIEGKTGAKHSAQKTSKKKKTRQQLEPKTTKDKIMERKQNKTNKKMMDNLRTLLNNSGKSNTVVRLKSFLHDL